ncbi:hypothetical protein [Streptomyces sp. NPDC001792]|jgi:hypothetical protein|uniref:hypothetical protein n=1 Tax=unclassified Streptomyces TaxID=2593676 RepID=UPI00332AF9E2
MQGLGYQPVKQPPHTAWLVLLRVLFVVIGFFSIGLMAWAMLLRLAIVTRRALDWCLFVAALVADILSLVLIGTEPGEDIHTPAGYFGMFLLLGTLVGTIAYYLAAEIRHYSRWQQAYATRAGQAGYAYPGPANPYTAATVPTVPIGRAGHDTPFPPAPAAPHTPPPMPHTPVPQPPPTTPPPRRPAPSHIDQVRAELDELSDYLRKHDGQQHGRPDGHEGGR